VAEDRLGHTSTGDLPTASLRLTFLAGLLDIVGVWR
jgi:hypothetical protein